MGWSLGGIMLLLAEAGEPGLPVRSISLVGSPFDFRKIRLFAPIRQLGRLTGGGLGTALYRMLGGAPASLVSLGFRLTSIDRYVTRPLWLAGHLQDREALAQMEAVDDYMAHMLAYPGRTFGQLYHAFFRVNDLERWPGTLHAVEHAAIGILPLFAICDRWDVGGVSTLRLPRAAAGGGGPGPGILVYDGYPGGAGVAELGFDAADRHLASTLELLEGCRCADGCPSCVQSPKCGNWNEPLDKDGAIRLLRTAR